MLVRMLRAVAIVVACWLALESLPAIARWLRMREM